MSRSRPEHSVSPERKPHHPVNKKVTLKQRGDVHKLPRDKDNKSEFSTDTPPSKDHHHSQHHHHHHHHNKHPVQYENTYKMAPDEGRSFSAHVVERIMKTTLEEKLKTVSYQAETCSKLAQDLCVSIKERAKDIGFHRYKLVTNVLVGQDTEQSVQMASRCLWNHTTDNFAAATYRNNSIYAIAVVYGIYLD